MGFSTLGSYKPKQEKSMKYNSCGGRTFHLLRRQNHNMIRHGHLILPVVLISETGRLGENN